MTEQQLEALADLTNSEMDKITEDLSPVHDLYLRSTMLLISRVSLRLPILVYHMPAVLRLIANSLDILIKDSKEVPPSKE